ncbi:uncharacterized protein RJT20DRAFT_5063 [Scheffersomyces xylosifermentans]|uniref:uncharacterized protein n=1 Tax=Scheffersomyces xylosifermentans TaxID=1304137 RepID=UPI00315CCDCA
MSIITNPSTYSKRDILLLAQILHSHGVLDSERLSRAADSRIQTILAEWKNHKVVKLENTQIKVNTRLQLQELYANLLKSYQVKDTTELANVAYYSRLEYLEKSLQEYKQEFQETLKES